MWSSIPRSRFRISEQLALRFLAAGFLLAMAFAGPVNATVILSGCGDAASDFSTSCSLAELDPIGPPPSGSITINDKIFENWGAFRTLSTFGNNDAFRAGIRVDPIDDPLNPGVRLVDTNGVWNHLNEFSFDDVDFDVRVLGGAALIQGVTLIAEIGRIAAAVQPGGIDGFVQVDYLVPTVIDSVEVTCEFVSCELSTITESIAFAPLALIELSGAIRVIAGQAPGAGQGAQLLSHTVLVSQVSAVSEPGTLMLLGLGLLGWAVRRR